MAHNDSWVLFKTYSNVQEAAIDRGLLQASGIPCVVNNATISSVYPMTDTWAPIELMIPASALSKAKALVGNGAGTPQNDK